MSIHSDTESPVIETNGAEAQSDITSTATAHDEPPTRNELTVQPTRSADGELGTKFDDDEPPRSVIYAPPGFREFKLEFPRFDSQSVSKSDATSSVDSDMTMMRLPLARISMRSSREASRGPLSPPPLSTAMTRDWSERGTPRAQTLQDFEGIERPSHSINLEDIPEGADALEKIGHEVGGTSKTLPWDAKAIPDSKDEIRILSAALAECWSLCNTLASLSFMHQDRLNCKGDVYEEAWKSCWALCRELYNSQSRNPGSEVNSTLDICRSFCQLLFDARHCNDELADSILRVSFELNNHLYNTHDRSLPDAFRERTLDFYITLCHRLMRQRTGTNDSESLLSICWSFAEILYSIRQSRREGRMLDEELLGSAVQACWELCDIFRKGWARRSLRSSDRGTPRPSQAAYPQTVRTREREPPKPDLSDKSLHLQRNPETPTTIFEDTAAASPDDVPIQNIFVLGQDITAWRSNSSDISENMQSREHSTNTITTSSSGPSLENLRILMTKAALNCGFLRNSPQTLSSFVKSLSSDAFGSTPWQIALLNNYKSMVAVDESFRDIGPHAHATGADIANAVMSTMQGGQFPWLGDLYRFVFGFHLQEAICRNDITIQV